MYIHVNMYLYTAHTRKAKIENRKEKEAAADCQKLMMKQDWTSSGWLLSQLEFLMYDVREVGRMWHVELIMLEKCWGLLGVPDEITHHCGV